MKAGHDLSRRSFLGYGAAVAVIVSPVSAFAKAKQPTEKWLQFDNLHTGEKLKTAYWQNGRYLPDSLKEINHILRDFRTGDVKSIDRDLLELLNALGRKMESKEPFQIISGYRSPKTNAMLRRNSNGVARKSYHMKGMAIDLNLPRQRLSHIRKAALDLKLGGVGYYPKSDFVHVDVGPVRTW